MTRQPPSRRLVRSPRATVCACAPSFATQRGLALAVAGCSANEGSAVTTTAGAGPSANEPVLITSRSQLDAAVGKRVTIVGKLTRTKIPTVLGVDVDGEYDLSERRVRVSGILHRTVVEPREPDPNEMPVATRGPGTYYSVVDPATEMLAKPVLDE